VWPTSQLGNALSSLHLNSATSQPKKKIK